MSIVYNRIEKMARSNNVLARRIAVKYELIRKRSGLFVGSMAGWLFSLLPVGLLGRIRGYGIRKIKMPYTKPIYISVDTFADISRSRFPLSEPETIEWIELYFKKGDVIYDVGANIGAVSLIAAAHLDRHCEIFSFEPSFSTYKQLCENIILNKFQEVISPFMMALSSSSGMDTLYYTSAHSGTSGHALAGFAEHNNQYQFKQQVIKYAIDDLLEKFNLPAPNHLKIDTDGHDLEVLRGAKKVFQQGAVKSVLIEKNKNERQIQEFMNNAGFIQKEIQSEDNLLFLKPL